jgi:hypothetical protein
VERGPVDALEEPVGLEVREICADDCVKKLEIAMKHS